MSAITPAQQIEIHDLLRQRRSGRAYDAAREATDADVAALLEAARWAPSGGNQQPWRYVVARKGDASYATLLGLLVPGNHAWAQHASALMLSAYAATRPTQDGQHVPNPSAAHDLGMANLSIALEAVNRGLMVHMMGGYNHDAARELIQAAANRYELGPMLAIGAAGDLAHLSEDIQKRELAPRTRKPAGEFLLRV